MGECHSGGRFLQLGYSFKNMNSGLDIYWLLIKFSDDIRRAG